MHQTNLVDWLREFLREYRKIYNELTPEELAKIVDDKRYGYYATGLDSAAVGINSLADFSKYIFPPLSGGRPKKKKK